ncbi:MAG TPA: ATP-binding protein [Thermoanaerobaculia bacterium]|jgi:signal transduction histidine kinase|nr:ATP-binding protein [Thermoanaerobaculia bacterium]
MTPSPPASAASLRWLMGLFCATLGALVLVAPHRFSTPGILEPYREIWGASALLSGVALLAVAALPRRRSSLAVHALAGSTLLALAAGFAGSRFWAAVLVYAGLGLITALAGFLPANPPATPLRTRLSLALATATSLALILATAVVTAQEERLAEEQVLATQRIEARAIARNVADYVEMNGARTFAVAALAGRAPLTFESHRPLLAGSLRSYPDVTAFRSLAIDGRTIAGAGAMQIPPQILRRLAAGIRSQSRIELTTAKAGARFLLLIGAPILDGGNEVVGVLVAAFDSETLARRIARPGSSVALGDGNGSLIAFRSQIHRHDEVSALPVGWDRQFRLSRRVARPGSVAGFAMVPGLGWVVAVEQPRSAALAGVRRGRDFAFGLLVLVVPLAVVGGVVAARLITRPLGRLADAVSELTTGNLAAPVATGSGVTEVERLAIAFRDMRDRLAERTRESERLADELRARAETLTEMDRRKNDFLAMLAHELRNPLGAIANASYLLEQSEPAEPHQQRAVAIIRRQIRHLVRMVEDLLDVSRVTRGKVELRRERIDFGEVVQHALETARPLAETKHQVLREELTSEPLPLDGDATRLEQVLSNLLRNAVKFTGKGGTIEISVDRDGAGEAVVLVRDDGIGIAPHLLPRIFDLFAQGEQTLDRSGAGLGIGLTLVRRLVEMHGGRVEARSSGSGKGSEFEVRLPLAALTTPTPPLPEGEEGKKKPLGVS